MFCGSLNRWHLCSKKNRLIHVSLALASEMLIVEAGAPGHLLPSWPQQRPQQSIPTQTVCQHAVWSVFGKQFPRQVSRVSFSIDYLTNNYTVCALGTYRPPSPFKAGTHLKVVIIGCVSCAEVESVGELQVPATTQQQQQSPRRGGGGGRLGLGGFRTGG